MNNQKMKLEKFIEIINKNGNNKSNLIAILQDIQSECNYLPEEALRIVATELNVSLTDVYGIATFFRSFSLKPRGKHLISVCLGTACHVRNAPRILTELQKRLGILPGETTKDNEFTLETVNCLGACALGPIVVIDDEYNGQVTVRKVNSILEKFTKKEVCHDKNRS